MVDLPNRLAKYGLPRERATRARDSCTVALTTCSTSLSSRLRSHMSSTIVRIFYHRPQLGHEMVKRRVDASERYRVYRSVAVLINIKAPGSSFDFAIPHQLVNDVTRVPKSVIVVPEADAVLIFEVAATVQDLESVSRHALHTTSIMFGYHRFLKPDVA